MLKTVLLLLVPVFVVACKYDRRPIVDPEFADSLVTRFTPSPNMKTTDENLDFWCKRMTQAPDNFVNGPKLAMALSSRFSFHQDIDDLLMADSLTREASKAYDNREAGFFLQRTHLALQQHQFRQAATFLSQARSLAGETYAVVVTEFDVFFESGQYTAAERTLRRMFPKNNYSYYFRRSKWEHFQGSLDSSIHYMLLAAGKSGNSKYLAQAALSNAADLCIHKGDLHQAYALYRQSIRIDGGDFHSILGMGWLALVHDLQPGIARKLFELVGLHTAAPDALLKLTYLAQQSGDTAMTRKFANAFILLAGSKKYGNMYNKYLVDIYTGILDEPALALNIAQKELENRFTPQTAAWWAWSLYKNHQPDKAYQAFRNYVSGRPLEGLELYFMGKMMQGLGKKYNANQFLEAAHENRYDLSPAQRADLESTL